MKQFLFISILSCLSFAGLSQHRFTITPTILSGVGANAHSGIVPVGFGLKNLMGSKWEFGEISWENKKKHRHSISFNVRINYIDFQLGRFAEKLYGEEVAVLHDYDLVVYVFNLTRLGVINRKSHFSLFRGLALNLLIYDGSATIMGYSHKTLENAGYATVNVERARQFEIQRINSINFEIGYQWVFQFHTANNSGDIGHEFICGFHVQLPDLYKITETEIRSQAPDPNVFYRVSFPTIRFGLSTRFLAIATFQKKNKAGL